MPAPVEVDVVLFDVNETLSDMAPMAARFADVGAPAGLAPLWFAAVLRDGFALTAAGRPGRFGEIGAGVLRGMLAAHGVPGDPDAAVAHVMQGFMALPVHPDVPAGVAALADGGLRLVTLSNGAAEVAERLLAGAGLRERFAACLSVDDAGAWKPDPRAYAYAARTCGVEPARMLMVAVHPWDIDGAAGAGLRTAWISRDRGPYPAHFRAPDVTVAGLDGLPGTLRPGRGG
jgi:2-haloacid dehalogenase